MPRQLINIAHNTFIESIRQPIYLVLVLGAAVVLVMSTAWTAYTFEEDTKLLIDLGLSSLLMAGLLLAAFTATGVVSDEIARKTVLTVVSKPVPRPVFVLGKFLGVAGALALAYWVLSLIFLLTVRHGVMQTASHAVDGPVLAFGLLAGFIALIVATLANYFYHWVFTSTLVILLTVLQTLAFVLVLVIDKGWNFQPITAEFLRDDGAWGQLVVALALVFQAVMIVTAAAVAASTRLGQIMTLLVCSLLVLLGLASHSLYNAFGRDSVLGTILYRVVPNFQFLWQADALTQGHWLNLSHFLVLSLYSLLYVGAILCLAVSLFQTREVG